MVEINKENAIDEKNSNSFFKVCLGIFLIPINLIFYFFIYFKITDFSLLIFAFLDYNERYIASTLISMSAIGILYFFILKNNIHRFLVVLPYSIPIFLLPFEPLSITAYIVSFISIIISHLFLMSYVGFKNLNISVVKQIFSYTVSIILGLLIFLVVIILINPSH